MVLGEVAHRARVAEQFFKVAQRQHEIEVVLAVALLDEIHFAIEIVRFALHDADLVRGGPARWRPLTLDQSIGE